jgi:predicted nucleic-acid-binding Zn-ribbon protein
MATLEDVKRVLALRGCELTCPVCGGQDFTSVAAEQGIALLYEGESTSWFSKPGYMPVIAATCTSCGYVMLFHRELVGANTGKHGSGC